jgi:hypothetical protein
MKHGTLEICFDIVALFLSASQTAVAQKLLWMPIKAVKGEIQTECRTHIDDMWKG